MRDTNYGRSQGRPAGEEACLGCFFFTTAADAKSTIEGFSSDHVLTLGQSIVAGPLKCLATYQSRLVQPFFSVCGEVSILVKELLIAVTAMIMLAAGLSS